MSADVALPRSLDELWPLLDQGYSVMAGGTDLLVKAAKLGQEPGPLACLERLSELHGVSERDGSIRIGAASPCSELLANELLRRKLPLLAQAVSQLGSPQIRNMATLGGNLVTASPAGDSLPALYALDALIELTSATGARCVKIDEFISGPGQVGLGKGEIVSALLLRPPSSGAMQSFEKVGRRKSLAVCVVSLAAVISQDARGKIASAKLAVGGAGPCVTRCRAAEDYLCGAKLSLESLRAAGEILRQELSPISDLRASAEYRRLVAGNLLLRLALLNKP